LTVFRIAFVRKVKGAEKAVGFKSTAWLRNLFDRFDWHTSC